MIRHSASEEVVRRPETKSFILTSEFWVVAGAAAAVLLAGYALDDIAEATAWKYGVWIAYVYIISRGIAKAGSQRDDRPDRRQMNRFDGDYSERDPRVVQETSGQPTRRSRRAVITSQQTASNLGTVQRRCPATCCVGFRRFIARSESH